MAGKKVFSLLRNAYVREYVNKVEKILEKRLPKKAEVHHVDGNRENNNNKNLVVCESRYYHRLLHSRLDALRNTGNPNARRCQFCHLWDDISNPDFRLYKRSGRRNGYYAIHRSCYNKQRKRKEVHGEQS